jgi:TPR repeat protein
MAPPAAVLPKAECDSLNDAIHQDEAADPLRARKRYAALCNHGCGDACWSAGALYQRPPSGTRDDATAFAFYQRACAAKSGIGCAALAFNYRMGWGVTRSLAEAKKYYRMGCELEFGVACGGLADLYQWQLDGGPPDGATAVKYYERACELHDGAGCSGAADLYAQGGGVARDDRRAYELYVQGCRYASASACAGTGKMLEVRAALAPTKGAELIRHADEAYRRGAAIARADCERGDPQQCAVLGDSYRLGKGVKRDVAEARRLYRIGCDGQMQLGCDGLRLLGEPAGVGSASDGARGPAARPSHDCSVVRCRDQSKVHLFDNSGQAFEVDVPASPYIDDAIVLYPGDDFFVTGDEKDGLLVNLRFVDPPAAPKEVLHVHFAQEKGVNGTYQMILTVQSFYGRWLGYHAIMHHASQPPRIYRQTSTCPIAPMARGMEMWPDTLSALRLRDFRFDQKGACTYY